MLKKLTLLLLALAGTVHAQTTTPTADSWEARVRNEANNGVYVYYIVPDGTGDQIATYNGTTNKPEYSKLGTGLSRSGNTLNIAPAWSTITGTPTTRAGYGITDAYPLSGNPSSFLTGITSGQVTTALGITPVDVAGARSAITLTTTGTSGAASYNPITGFLNVPQYPGATGTVTSVTAGTGLSGGTITTTGTISLPNTGTAGTYNNVTTDAQGRVTSGSNTAFTFSQPAARTMAVSTDYQATDPTKAAVIYPSYACQNATTILAASACTIQVRMGASALNCATGTVYYTQSLTVGLGLLLTQNSTNPVPIFLPIGGHVIFCATAGTFTITTVEQSAG